MGERLLCKQEVIGSIPFTSTIWHLHHLAPPPFATSTTGVVCQWGLRGTDARFGEDEETPSRGAVRAGGGVLIEG